MRNDENLSTDVDCIPQFSWIMFLKCFDDFEGKLDTIDPKYRRVIPNGYRWRDWASETARDGKSKKVLTGDDLIKFVNDKLFPTLARLVGGKKHRRKDIMASIFKELINRFVNGYVLRKVLNLIDKISFVSTNEIHMMAHVYEQLLVEMRDAAGTHGEFYTPRPVIQFIVNQINPNLSKFEKVLDPACGTGGFLIESLAHMKKQVGPTSDYTRLMTKTVYGIEKKPMPYLLGMMNMLLHEVDEPNIARTNTLAKPIREISTNSQYQVIMTNPPFGGKEEEEILFNLPVGMQTSETASAFLLYIMASLKNKGRCAIILPDGLLFGTGVVTKIKKKLLDEFNLHTIVRLPRSVFEPYTPIATNILFFDKSGVTKDIWYYQMKVSERVKGRAKVPRYSKTKPIIYEDFAEVEKWFKRKTKNSNAWKVNIKDISDFNLDISNPSDVRDELILPPEPLVDTFISVRKEMIQLFEDIKKIIHREVPR